MSTKKKNLKVWESAVNKIDGLSKEIKIAVAGKYTELKDAYKSIHEALYHAGLANNVAVEIKYVDVQKKSSINEFSTCDGILVPGGFGERGIEGKINAVKFARESRVPFLGICLGMQCAVIEFSRNVCGFKGANSTEFNPRTRYPVIDLLPEQKKISAKGGTMRLGIYPCKIKKNTLAYKAYKPNKLVWERHRHRYELNNKFRKKLSSKGLIVAGEYPKRKLAEIMELRKHPWFVAVQFHPEFKSRPIKPHPLFRDFIESAVQYRYKKI